MQVLQIIELISLLFMAMLTAKTLVLIWFASKSYRSQQKKNLGRELVYPLVSILSPCYNEGITLRNCINGLVTQSYSNLEIIIINDGSTDNTKQIGEQLANEYPTKVKFRR